MPTNSWQKMKLLMRLAPSTEEEDTTTDLNAHPLTSARTATQMNPVSSQMLITSITLINMVPLKEKMLWSKKSIKEDPLLAVLPYQLILRHILEVSMKTKLETKTSSTIFLLSDSVLRMVLNIGLLETHGEPNSEKVDSSESSEELTTLLLKATVHGLPSRIHGHNKSNTLQLMLKRMTHVTTLPTHPCLNQNLLLSYQPTTEHARELPKFNLPQKKNKLQTDQWPGTPSMLLLSQPIGIGEASMDKTMSHGTLTNIFLNIVDHVGLKVPHQLLLIDSTFLPRI